MTSLLLFGASRGVGLEVARLARSSGCAVAAMTRTPSAELAGLGVRQFPGDACQRKRLFEALRDGPRAEAVVCTISGGPLGASADCMGTINVIDGAKRLGISRFLLVSSLGAGNSRPHASQKLISAIGPILDEKTRAEDHLMASGLEFTIIRAGGLLNGAATGRAGLHEDPGVHGRISRADLAALIMDCLGNPDSIGRIFSAVE